MANLPGFGNPPTMPAQFATLVARLLQYCDAGVTDVSNAQLCDTHGGTTNSIGWDVWHVVRTVDNIVHFVFERDQPVWLSGGFDVRWSLPRVDQGTGQDQNDAYSLSFPDSGEFRTYIAAVGKAVVPRVAAMSMQYLSTVQYIRPWGDVPRMEAIGHGLIGHGNGHLGRVSLARTLSGLPGLAF